MTSLWENRKDAIILKDKAKDLAFKVKDKPSLVTTGHQILLKAVTVTISSSWSVLSTKLKR